METETLRGCAGCDQFPEAEEIRAIIRDYFQNDIEGWTRPWLSWRDRAAKAVGLPTSEELHRGT